MPVIVLRNKNTDIEPWTVDLPEGADPQLVADAWSGEGWVLDTDTTETPAPAAGDPLDLDSPAEPVNPEGN